MTFCPIENPTTVNPHSRTPMRPHPGFLCSVTVAMLSAAIRISRDLRWRVGRTVTGRGVTDQVGVPFLAAYVARSSRATQRHGWGGAVSARTQPMSVRLGVFGSRCFGDAVDGPSWP